MIAKRSCSGCPDMSLTLQPRVLACVCIYPSLVTCDSSQENQGRQTHHTLIRFTREVRTSTRHATPAASERFVRFTIDDVIVATCGCAAGKTLRHRCMCCASRSPAAKRTTSRTVTSI